MNNLPIVFAFTAGMLASVNPCGFAMLPSFVGFYLTDGTVAEPQPRSVGLWRAVSLGGLVTVGFLLVFVVVGLLFSAGGRFLIQLTPWFGILVGVLLVVMGIAMLLGHGVSLPISIPQWQFQTRTPRSMVLYGVAYALVSLGCTLPVFLSVFAGALATSGIFATGILFLAYSLGMGTVITGLAIATVVFEGVVTKQFRRLMPYVKVFSAVALILAGIYLVYSQIVLNPLFRV
ncbi:MAG: cytochrome c biogenesis protein CcdA [Anaerolineaceae bacterium]|nr:cytochrome c biogenesis protein CcdA [Anaerolineaceae bacterium]